MADEKTNEQQEMTQEEKDALLTKLLEEKKKKRSVLSLEDEPVGKEINKDTSDKPVPKVLSKETLLLIISTYQNADKVYTLEDNRQVRFFRMETAEAFTEIRKAFVTHYKSLDEEEKTVPIEKKYVQHALQVLKTFAESGLIDVKNGVRTFYAMSDWDKVLAAFKEAQEFLK